MMKLGRLKNKEDFARIRKQGRKYYGKYLMMSALKGNLDEVKLGVVVAKKVSNKAVERNKIRRRIKDIIRNFSRDNDIGVEIVISVNGEALEATFQDLRDETVKGLEKVFKGER